MIRFVPLLLAALLAACVPAAAPPEDAEPARILVMGDSLMAFHRGRGASVADALAAALGEPVTDRSAKGASVLRPPGSERDRATIRTQFIAGPWDWVIINGFGNDLLFSCGCGECADTLAGLVSEDGRSGAIPQMVADLRATGARIVYTGYLRTPGFTAPTERCADLGLMMDARLSAMAARDPGVTYLSLARIVPEGDRSFHAIDRVHPSPKGAAAIAREVLEVIR